MICSLPLAVKFFGELKLHLILLPLLLSIRLPHARPSFQFVDSLQGFAVRSSTTEDAPDVRFLKIVGFLAVLSVRLKKL